MKVNGIDAIILKTDSPRKLAEFYKQFGLDLCEEDHGNGVHYGCRIGNIHFAIHSGNVGNQSISFNVEDVDLAIEVLKGNGVKVVLDPADRPYGRLASVEDPDGNEVFLHKF